MASNPNPAGTAEPMWRFIERVLALEPDDFVFSGAFGTKRGYHSSVLNNLARFPGDYSIRLADDLVSFNRQYGRAFDVKSLQAAAGARPTIMAKYGRRMRAAALARDPRVRKWREVLGQFDEDTPPEAIDFQSRGERQPDDTHVWHFHWSILTRWVADPEAYDAMYSVLIGQSLRNFQEQGAPDMAFMDDPHAAEVAWRTDALFADVPATRGGSYVGQPEGANKLHAHLVQLDAALAAVDAKVSALSAPMLTDEQLDAALAAVDAKVSALSAPVLTDEQLDVLADKVARRLTELRFMADGG